MMRQKTENLNVTFQMCCLSRTFLGLFLILEKSAFILKLLRTCLESLNNEWYKHAFKVHLVKLNVFDTFISNV